jgi:hypothetical protein
MVPNMSSQSSCSEGQHLDSIQIKSIGSTFSQHHLTTMCSLPLSSIHYENSFSSVFTNVVLACETAFGMQPLWQWAFPLEPNKQVSKLPAPACGDWFYCSYRGFWRFIVCTPDQELPVCGGGIFRFLRFSLSWSSRCVVFIRYTRKTWMQSLGRHRPMRALLFEGSHGLFRLFETRRLLL